MRFFDSGNVCRRFDDFVSSKNVQGIRRNREPHCSTSALLRAASRILTDDEEDTAAASMVETRSRMLAVELVVGENLLDFDSDVCGGSADRK